MLLSVGACLIFVASTKCKISHLCSIHITCDETLRPCHEWCGKIHQAFWLRFCILQVMKSWSRGRPGNEGMLAHFNSANNVHWVICIYFHVTCPTNSCPQSILIHNQWYFFLLSPPLDKCMWLVEIKHYSVAYFNYVIMFDALWLEHLYMNTSTHHVWAPPSVKVLYYSI